MNLSPLSPVTAAVTGPVTNSTLSPSTENKVNMLQNIAPPTKVLPKAPVRSVGKLVTDDNVDGNVVEGLPSTLGVTDVVKPVLGQNPALKPSLKHASGSKQNPIQDPISKAPLKPQSEPKSVPGPETKRNLRSSSELPKTERKSIPDPKVVPAVQPKPLPEGQLTSETEAKAQSIPKSKVDSEAESKPQSEDKSQVKSENKPKSKVDSEAESKPQSEAKSQVEPEDKKKSKRDSKPTPEEKPKVEETPEEKAAREQIEQDRKLALQISGCLEQCLDKVEPICRAITEKINRADATPRDQLDQDQLVDEVRPLIEEGGRALQECYGIIRGADPDGHIQAQARQRSAAAQASPEEHHLAELIKKLTENVSTTIENAKMKLQSMPKAQKGLSPFWAGLIEPLIEIVAAIGLLLAGVLGIVHRLLKGLGLSGMLYKLLSGLGVNKLLGYLGIDRLIDSLGLGAITSQLISAPGVKKGGLLGFGLLGIL